MKYMIDRKSDYLAYHQSIALELNATKDQVRQLIGSSHWPSDGEHKEAILRRVLRSRLPVSFQVGSGFVCYECATSTQIDILIISENKPTLFKDGSFFIVTPDTAKAIIEVKTTTDKTALEVAFQKLADNIGNVRDSGNFNCCAGLSVYEDTESISDEFVLKQLHNSAKESQNRAINWVALGPNRFFRFWSNGEDVESKYDGPTWHSYNMNKGLAHAYFISNVVWDTTPNNNPSMQYAWFPIKGGKEGHRKWCISLNDDKLIQF
jgi:hypothetical protein